MATVVNITDYVETLPPAKRDKLYESPWTCQAVLRSLPALAKQYVLRLLWVERPVSKDDVNNWIKDKKRFESQHRAALSSLYGLGIFQDATVDHGKPAVILHATFKDQLKWALSGRSHLIQDLPANIQASTPSTEQLDKYAHQQWESLQLYILTNSSPPPTLPDYISAATLDMHRLLVTAELLTGDKRHRSITDAGFQFLLKDNYRQLWTFLTEYIKDAELRSGSELSSVMSFLMQLGFHHVGQPCAFDALQPMERSIAAHMMQLGLLLPFRHPQQQQGGGGAIYFCPTRLASSLCGGFNPAASSVNADIAGGHIIVETNYRVYAYTSSPVQVAILELFCRSDCVLPNLFVGTLTRDSVSKALQSGIGAEEIVTYLQQHAHPHVASRVPVVPEVVTDQVRLWEADMLRVRTDPAVLYDQFESLELFIKSLEYARNLGVLLWCNTDAKLFAAKESGHEQIKGYIQQLKKR